MTRRLQLTTNRAGLGSVLRVQSQVANIINADSRWGSSVCLGLWSLWLTWPYWAFGPNSFIPVIDVSMSNLPYHIIAARDLVQRGITFWRPEMSSGLDESMLIAGYSLRLLPFAILPPWLAHGFLMWLNVLVAAFFTYRFCRDVFALNKFPAVFAAMAFSTPLSFQFLPVVLSLSTIPFYLWAFDRLIRRRGTGKFLLIGMMGILISLHTILGYSLIYFWFWLLVWFVFIRQYCDRSFFLGYFIFVACSGTVSALLNWSLWVNASLAPRPDLLRLDLGSIFGSLWSLKLELALALLGLWVIRFKDRLLAKLFALAVLALASGELVSLVLVLFRSSLGFLTGVEFRHIADSAPFFALVGGTYGLNLLYEKGADYRANLTLERVSISSLFTRGRRVNMSYLVMLLPIAVVFYQSLSYVGEFAARVPAESYAANFQNPDLIRLAVSGDAHLYRVATLGSDFGFSGFLLRSPRDSIHPAYMAAYGLETVDGYLGLYYDRYREYWLRVVQPLTKKDSTAAQFFAVQSRNHPNLYVPPHLFHRAFVDGESFAFSSYYNLNLLSLANAKYIITLWPLADPDLRLVNDPSSTIELRRMWGTRSTLERQIRFWLGEYPPRLLYIYENVKALPRAFLAPSVAVFDTSTQLLDALSDAPLAKISQTAFILKADAVSIATRPLGFSRGSAKITEYTPDRVTISVESDGPGILVYSGNYTPYWQAFVDGQSAVLLPAYHTFQGVYVEAGQHQVVLEYMPPYKTMGLEMFRRVGLAK